MKPHGISCIVYPVFNKISCSAEGCKNRAVADAATCYFHLKDKQAYEERIRAFMEERRSFKNLELSGIPLENLDLSEREFWFCNFSHSRFSNVRFAKSKFLLSFFDFSSFADCHWMNVDARLTVFAGSSFKGCSFVDSDMLRCSFVGINVIEGRFEGIDLYDSRFTNSILERTSFRDSNLKRAHFKKSKLIQVSFSSSNVEEAYFEQVERHE